MTVHFEFLEYLWSSRTFFIIYFRTLNLIFFFGQIHTKNDVLKMRDLHLNIPIGSVGYFQ